MKHGNVSLLKLEAILENTYEHEVLTENSCDVVVEFKVVVDIIVAYVVFSFTVLRLEICDYIFTDIL